MYNLIITPGLTAVNDQSAAGDKTGTVRSQVGDVRDLRVVVNSFMPNVISGNYQPSGYHGRRKICRHDPRCNIIAAFEGVDFSPTGRGVAPVVFFGSGARHKYHMTYEQREVLR